MHPQIKLIQAHIYSLTEIERFNLISHTLLRGQDLIIHRIGCCVILKPKFNPECYMVLNKQNCEIIYFSRESEAIDYCLDYINSSGYSCCENN